MKMRWKLALHEYRWPIAAITILIAAFALRSLQFGNPLIEIDEDFYVLVGDRMWQGALPYVDIWDRKPIGLFLIYAAIRLLGGDGIVEYQIVATLFAAGTGFLIARMAAGMAGIVAATTAGIFYILMLGLIGGGGGQSPVFYNLPVAAAALLTFRAMTAPPADIRRFGCVVMLLTGIALQIKYTVVFEGMFFGLLLLYRSWRTSGSLRRTAVDGVFWIALALLPTLLAFAYYAWLDEAAAFLHANFLSIGRRAKPPLGEALVRLGKALRAAAVPLLAILATVSLKPWRAFDRGGQTFAFALSWLGAAVTGYLLFGTYFDHYLLPVFVPMALACAPLLSCRKGRIGLIFGTAMLIAGTVADVTIIRELNDRRGTAETAAAWVAVIKPRLTNCMFVYQGNTILYHLTQSCLPTRYPFPSHLNYLREIDAIGSDPIEEIRHILAKQPSVIVDQLPHPDRINPAATAVVQAELDRNYRPVASFPLTESQTIIYERIKGQ